MPTTKATIYFNDDHVEVRDVISFSHLGIELVGRAMTDHDGVDVISRDGSEFISSHCYKRVAFAGTPPSTALRTDEIGWARNLYLFMLREYAAEPDTGQVVTPDIRPMFHGLCEFLAQRDRFPFGLSQ